MHEKTMTIGIANKKTPRIVEWQTIYINLNNGQFKKYYNLLTNSVNRQMYLLILYFDARESWIDNNTGTNISGLLLSASYSFNFESDVTRTFNFSFYADGTESVYISPRNVCKFYVGLSTEQDMEHIVYFCLGGGIIDAPSWNYDSKTKNVSFNAIDLCCLLDGTHAGYISAKNIWEFDQDSSVKNNIIGLLKFEVQTNQGYCIEYTDESIDECVFTDGSECKNQLEVDSKETGSTIMELLNEMKEQSSLQYYAYYFDSNGLFNYSIWPSADLNRYVQYIIPQKLVISEDETKSFNGRYNYVEVWGLTLDTSNMDIDIIRDEGSAGELICDGESYEYTYKGNTKIVITGITEDTSDGGSIMHCYCPRLPDVQEDLEYVGDTSWGCNIIDLIDKDVKLPLKILINDMVDDSSNPVYYTVDDDIPLDDRVIIYLDRDPEDTVTGGTRSNYKYYFTSAGRIQPYAIAEDYDGEYGINNIGYVRKISSNPECVNEKECLDQAKWQLYNSTLISKTVQLSIVPLYFVQAGHLVDYTSVRTGETDTYMITSVSCNVNTNNIMNITMQKFYSYYEEM